VPRLSGYSTWCVACLDGMRRRLAEGFASAPSSPANLPPESSCSLSSTSPAGWCCQSCLSSAGGAWPRGGGALPSVLSFKDVRQPCGGGERARLWLHLPHELVTRLFLQHLGGKDGHQPCEGRRQTSATRHRPDRKRRLPPCFQLLGLDGLVVTLVGGWGQGPPRHGAHAKMVATASKPLVQRWSPPLASRSELASNATLLVQSSPYL
jgi:hypothetical protein